MLHGVAVELIAKRGKSVTPALSVETSIDGPSDRLSDTPQRHAPALGDHGVREVRGDGARAVLNKRVPVRSADEV